MFCLKEYVQQLAEANALRSQSHVREKWSNTVSKSGVV